MAKGHLLCILVNFNTRHCCPNSPKWLLIRRSFAVGRWFRFHFCHWPMGRIPSNHYSQEECRALASDSDYRSREQRIIVATTLLWLFGSILYFAISYALNIYAFHFGNNVPLWYEFPTALIIVVGIVLSGGHWFFIGLGSSTSQFFQSGTSTSP